MIKIAQTETLQGKKHVTVLMSKGLPSREPDAIAEIIKDFFQSSGSMGRKIQLNIPRHLVTARSLKIPSIDDDEIGKIIKIESLKHLPYSDENVIYGYRIIEKLEDGYSKVLLVIAQANIIKSYTDVLKAAGLRGPQSLSLSSEALFLWYMLVMGEEEKVNVMLVNLDSDHIDIDIIEKDKLVFTRGVAYGFDDPKKKDRIAEQIKISLHTYQKESSKTVNRVILTGKATDIEKFEPILAKELKLPVEIINQVKNIPMNENIKEGDIDASYAELLGLSLRPEEIKINLLPEDVREETRMIMAKNNLVTAVFLVAILAMMACGIFLKKLHDKDIYLSVINAEVKKIDPKVITAKKMLKDMNIMRELMSRKPLAVDIVSEIYGITPSGIFLSMLNFDSNESVTVRGNAPTLSEVFKYVSILENSHYFEGVKVKYANKRTSGNKEIADFEIESLLSKVK